MAEERRPRKTGVSRPAKRTTDAPFKRGAAGKPATGRTGIKRSAPGSSPGGPRRSAGGTGRSTSGASRSLAAPKRTGRSDSPAKFGDTPRRTSSAPRSSGDRPKNFGDRPTRSSGPGRAGDGARSSGPRTGGFGDGPRRSAAGGPRGGRPAASRSGPPRTGAPRTGAPRRGGSRPGAASDRPSRPISRSREDEPPTLKRRAPDSTDETSARPQRRLSTDRPRSGAPTRAAGPRATGSREGFGGKPARSFEKRSFGDRPAGGPRKSLTSAPRSGGPRLTPPPRKPSEPLTLTKRDGSTTEAAAAGGAVGEAAPRVPKRSIPLSKKTSDSDAPIGEKRAPTVRPTLKKAADSEGRPAPKERKSTTREARLGDTTRKFGVRRGTLTTRESGKRKIVKRGSRKIETQREESPIAAMRLNRFIASSGVTSRRKADELIAAGKVTVNGKTVTEMGVTVQPYQDQVVVDGKTVSLRPRYTYILLNKPKDTITTLSDESDRRTVMEYVSTHERVFPVGRLDRNTTGVLLFTNDGDLTNRLTHPSYEIEREYHVTLDKPLKRDDAKKIAAGGVDIGDGDITGPALLAVADKDPKDVVITIREGKNREVRRIFEAFGYDVEKLDRKSFAGIDHRGMGRGETRPLSPAEIRMLKKRVGIEDQY